MRPITVKEAIHRGMRLIALPSKIMMILSVSLPALLVVSGFPLSYFLLLPLCVCLSFIYTAWATPRWRIWAYKYVNDIHQLQRSAEIAGLLMLQSHERIGGFLSNYQIETLKTLQNRFQEEPVFVDDHSIPNETLLSSNHASAITLSSFGIQLPSGEIFEWSEIVNERIARITYNRMSARTGGTVSAGAENFFRFEYPSGSFEASLSSLNISEWELDLLLYIYCGRFIENQKRN